MPTTEAHRLRGAERRKIPRTPVYWPARVLFDGHAIDSTIFDVSPVGAGLRLENPPDHAKTVTLQNARFGEFLGEVMWCGDDVIGLSFLAQPRRIAQLIKGIPPQYRSAW